MKQLFLIALLCGICSLSHAQISSLTITNNTNCTIHIRLAGNVNGSGCSGIAYVSGVIAVAPTASFTWDPSQVTGGGMTCATCTPTTLGSTDEFNAVHIHEFAPGSIGCSPSRYTVGESCVGLSSSASFNAYDTMCNACSWGTINASWTSTATTATITFN